MAIRRKFKQHLRKWPKLEMEYKKLNVNKNSRFNIKMKRKLKMFP